jgi:hypothetical protein
MNMNLGRYRDLAEKWAQLAATVPDPATREVCRGLADGYAAMADTTEYVNPLPASDGFTDYGPEMEQPSKPAALVVA